MPSISIESEFKRGYVIYAFSFQSVNRPIPINAYALSVWTGEYFDSLRLLSTSFRVERAFLEAEIIYSSPIANSSGFTSA